MRVSKALTSLIYGVSTDNHRLRSPQYLESLDNFQTVEGEGLHRRPPAMLINNEAFGWYTNTATFKTIIKSFELQGTLLYLQITYEVAAPEATPAVYIVGADGVSITNNIGIAYLANITHQSHVEITSQEDTVFILNKNAVIAVESTQTAYNTTSLILVERAPVAGSTLKMSFTDTNDASQTVNYVVPTTALANGTNTVAIAIANAINVAAHVGITAQTRGSVVALIRTDNLYAEAAVEDEAGGTVLEAINGEVQSINTLPKYIPGIQLLTVRPVTDSEKGKFYLKALTTGQVTVPADPTRDVKITAAQILPGIVGYSSGTGGSITPNPWLVNGVSVTTATTFLLTDGQYQFSIQGSTDMSTPALTRITVRDTLTGASIGDGVPQIISNGCRILGVSPMLPGREYDVFINAEFGISNNLLQVKWEETLAPHIPNKLLDTTMPHTVEEIVGGYEIVPFQWEERTAGDEVTNPLPGFVGKTIKSLKIFQNRLVALYNENIATTETDNNRSWWRSTVTQLLATHPVQLRSTSVASDEFHTALNHNKDLLLFSSKSQFKLAGNVALTPETAGMPQTSSYVNEPTVDPISVGENVYFAFNHGNFMGLSKYTSATAENKPDNANPITDHVNTYMLGKPHKLLSDANLGILYAIFDSEIYVCDFDTAVVTNETPRYAWSKWKSFAGSQEVTILEADIIGNDLQLVVNKGTAVQVLQLAMLTSPVSIGKTVYLDYQVTTTVHSSGLVTLPTNYAVNTDTMRVIHAEGEEFAGAQIQWTHTGTDELTLVDVVDTTNVVIGHTYRSSLIPSTLYIKDASGHVNTFANLSIWKWLISLTNSADVTAKILSQYHDIPDQYYPGLVVYDINTTTDSVANNTDTFDVGYNQPSELAALEISSEGHLPVNITDIQWSGKYNSRGKRF